MTSTGPSLVPVRTGGRLAGKHFPGLDGIRGLAILGVLVTHAVPRLLNPGPLGYWYNQLIEQGAFGVDLFFVLSGFLITGVLLDTRDSPGYFTNFYARRLLRLMPVYYLYLAACAIVIPAIHRAFHSRMADYDGNWLWYLLYASNLKPGHGAQDEYLGHFWSLAIEEQFYLFWPAVVFVFRRRLLYCCFAAITVAVALRVIFSRSGVDWNTIYRLTPMRLDALALGAIGAIVFHTRASAERGPASAWKVLFAGMSLFIVCVGWAQSTSWQAAPIQTWGALFLAIAFAGFVYLAASSGTGVARVLSTPWLRRFGKYSYTIYVVHVVIGAHVFWAAAALARRTGPWPYGAQLACSAVVVALSYGFAALSWKYFEEPILRLKKRFGGLPET